MDPAHARLGFRLLCGALLFGLLASPLGAQPASGPRVPARVFRLANGLTAILHQDRSVPVVSVNIWYHVGSANEKPGRTGFAHLFEHLMFEGSKHVKEGEFDLLLESAGGSNNGSTTTDRTNYYEDVPSNALELALFLESDRMGYLLDAMSPDAVDGQRDVVKNERRQSYENRPYGMAWLELDRLLFPEGHPYSWPTIGHMEDLTAASYDDVVEFFKRYYVPNNASLVVAGDIDFDETAVLVRKWFGDIPRGASVEPLSVPEPRLTAVVRRTLTDRVQLPRLYLGWLSPRRFAADDAALDVAAAILTDGKNSRLYKRLVFDTHMAQDVAAYQDGRTLAGSFQIVSTARPDRSIAEVQAVIDAEIDRLRREPPGLREIERAVNQIEASFYRAMERVGSYRGKAEQLNAYYTFTGEPDYFAKDLARYKALTPADIQRAVAAWLPADRRVELVVEPEKTPDDAPVPQSEESPAEPSETAQ
jgi:zinc protease